MRDSDEKNVNISEDNHLRLKLLAVQEGIHLKVLINRILKKYLDDL